LEGATNSSRKSGLEGSLRYAVLIAALFESVMAGQKRVEDARERAYARPSTSLMPQDQEDVDARDKRGHDAKEPNTIETGYRIPKCADTLDHPVGGRGLREPGDGAGHRLAPAADRR
jgi:hypothetical protein